MSNDIEEIKANENTSLLMDTGKKYLLSEDETPQHSAVDVLPGSPKEQWEIVFVFENEDYSPEHGYTPKEKRLGKGKAPIAPAAGLTADTQPLSHYDGANTSGGAAGAGAGGGGGGGGSMPHNTSRMSLALHWEAEELERRQKIHDARRDITKKLRQSGLIVSKRVSKDGTQIFLLVTANQERLEVQAEYEGIELKLKDEYGGGYTAFTKDKQHLFRGTEKSFFRRTRKQEIINHIIQGDPLEGGAGINMHDLIAAGVLQKCFPLHENHSVRDLMATWVKKPLTKQPLRAVRNYFGEEVAFYFAFVGFYTQWLGYASVFGIIAYIAGFISHDDGWAASVYSVVLALWATLFLEFWKRERSAQAWAWNTTDYEHKEGHRPGFEGEEVIGAYNKGEFIRLTEKDVLPGLPKEQVLRKVKYYPPEKIVVRMFVGFSAVVTLCMVVIIATVSILTFRLWMAGHASTSLAGTFGSILNAITIIVLNRVYRTVAMKLNHWENHRTQTEFDNQLLFKIFLFQFVNSYTVLYYIAFVKNNAQLWGNSKLTDKCSSAEDGNMNTLWHGCMHELTLQLISILGTNIVVGQSQEVLMPYAMSKYTYIKAFLKGEHHLPKLKKYEREAQLQDFPGIFDEYSEMIIQYGYLTLFATAFPLAPLLAFANNLIEIRTDAFKMLSSFNKPFYKGASDIGAWFEILQFLGIISVVTNCLLVGFTFESVYSLTQNPYRTLWAIVIIEHVCLLLKYLLALGIPDISSEVREQMARQDYINQQLIRLYEKKVPLQEEIKDSEEL